MSESASKGLNAGKILPSLFVFSCMPNPSFADPTTKISSSLICTPVASETTVWTCLSCSSEKWVQSLIRTLVCTKSFAGVSRMRVLKSAASMCFFVQMRDGVDKSDDAIPLTYQWLRWQAILITATVSHWYKIGTGFIAIPRGPYRSGLEGEPAQSIIGAVHAWILSAARVKQLPAAGELTLAGVLPRMRSPRHGYRGTHSENFSRAALMATWFKYSSSRASAVVEACSSMRMLRGESS